jgi:predicted aspartyl protease
MKRPALWAVVSIIGLLGCAQQNDPMRQAHVDSFCHDPRGGGDTPQGVAICQHYYHWYPEISPPVNLAPYQPAAYSPSTPVPPSTAQSRTEVALSRNGGTAIVPVTINGTLRLGFIVDSGASSVVIPNDVVMTLVRTGTLRADDFLGKQTYVLADGSKLPSVTFRIRSLKVGDKVLENVTGSASPASGDPLLGQSFLSRFQSWSIDNARGVLVLD